MKRTLRAALAAAVLFALALVVLSSEARAAEEFDPKEELAYPGTRLLVVEFYSIDCKPCMAAVPKWKALHAKYRSKGLRFVVVKAEDDGRCVNLAWSPDRSICDEDDQIFKSMRVKTLPSAFVWSWTGELLVNGGHVEDVERVIEGELVKMPRVAIHLEGSEKALPEAERFVRAELNRAGKIQAAATAAEVKAIESVQRASMGTDRDERAQCEIGKTLGANSILTLSVGKSASPKFIVELRDASSGCTVGVGRSPWEPGSPDRSAAVAVADLLANVAKPPQRPWLGKAEPAPAPGPVKREDKIQNASDSKWKPSSSDPVLVSLESQPAGARVEMDGATLCASTPCKKMVEPGLRTFRISADKCVTKEERVRVDGDEQKVAWKLDANTATVTVNTGAVSGVPITVDGEAAGKSPLRVELAAGPHRIEIKDACYEPARADIGVERGVAKRVELNGVQKTAGLRVELSDANDEPVQGDVKLDGVVVGRTWKTLTVPACGKELEVVAKEGGVRQTVILRARETTKVGAKVGRVTADVASAGSDSSSVANARMVRVPGSEGFLGLRRMQPFDLDATEVTVDAYAECVRSGECVAPATDVGCNWGARDRGKHPVNCVDWNQAEAFCAWAGKRLPSEDEWQRAAEGAASRVYPWGDSAPARQLCWASTANGGTCEVGRFAAGDSAQGAKDLAGNVWEWTESCYYTTCTARVTRGGGWGDDDVSLFRASARVGDAPSTRSPYVGFRCAR
jgi:formylglycine-generating enzyme required for sulfatase activity/thiol-disulfide isomerase/thioredoxin